MIFYMCKLINSGLLDIYIKNIYIFYPKKDVIIVSEQIGPGATSLILLANPIWTMVFFCPALSSCTTFLNFFLIELVVCIIKQLKQVSTKSKNF